MEVAITDITDVEKEIQIQVPAQELVPHFEDAYKRERLKIEVKGFRKGKAPLELVKKIYGESIEYDSLSKIANDVYRRLTEEKNIEPLGEPVLTDMDYKRGEQLRFKVKYEIKPKFELHTYKGIALEKVVHRVSDAEVEDELGRLRKANSSLSEVNSAADDEHIVTVDVQELDHAGTPLIGKKNPDMRIYLADESVHPDVKKALQGASAGDIRRASFETERDGKKTQHHIECTVKKVEKVSFPEINDDFVKKVTKDKVAHLDEFRRQIRNDLESYWKETAERNMTDALIGEIVRQHDFHVPESLTKAVTDGYLEELKGQNPKKQLPKDFDETKFREEYRPSAIFQAKWYLIRERIIETEQVKIEDVDVQHRAELDAPTMGIEKERLTAFYKNSQTVLDRILSEKMMAFLKAQSVISEKVTDEFPA